MFINQSTKIFLSAKDGESGLQYISYSVDGVSEETRYEEPFVIEQSGLHNIEIFSYDNVNNRNIKKFYCLVDGDPPKLITNFSIEPIGRKEGLPVYPSYVTLFLAATDRAVGAGKIFFQVNKSPEQSYSGAINGFSKNTKYSIKVRGRDLLGNETSKTIEFYTKD